jgi:xylan 1,4-beta-xylosidase
LGTVRVENGKNVYDWTKIDQLYDDLLARRIKPFVELGFTPNAMKTSDNKIFYWQGNTSHPAPAAWKDLIDAFIQPHRKTLWAGRSAHLVFRGVERA